MWLCGCLAGTYRSSSLLVAYFVLVLCYTILHPSSMHRDGKVLLLFIQRKFMHTLKGCFCHPHTCSASYAG